MMKINFQCGTDVILGWKNYDLNPSGPNVELLDFRQWQGAEPNSVENIKLNNSVELCTLPELFSLLNKFYQSLISGGNLYIQCYHGSLLANSFSFGNIPVEQYNQMVFGDPKNPNRCILSIEILEGMLEQIGYKIQHKGIIGQMFFVRAIK